jgi:hypothetical protein
MESREKNRVIFTQTTNALSSLNQSPVEASKPCVALHFVSLPWHCSFKMVGAETQFHNPT